MAQQPMGRIDSLDGLRGIAILFVFFFHYLPRNPWNPLSLFASLGWTGVDLFFVLSGFLITGILYDTRDSGNFFKVFYARRALRLFPVYLLAVGVVLVTASLLHTEMTWKAIPFYIYGANIMLVVKDGVPDFTPYFQCIHFWSLSTEEQFYSLWPLAIFFVRGRRTMMNLCAGGIIGALLFRIVLMHFGASTWMLYTELPSRMDSLLAGAMLALAIRGTRSTLLLRPKKLYLLMASFCFVSAILFIRARTLFLDSREMTSFGYTTLAGMYTCLIALALVPGTLPNRIGRISILRFFGRYSYGLYIWHDLPSPICVAWVPWFVRNIRPLALAQTTYAMAMLALFTAISVLSYRLFEIRFLRLKVHFQYASIES